MMPYPASHAVARLLACSIFGSLAGAQAHDTVLQPAHHASRSGEYVLEIEPSSPDGRGPARYTLTRRGETLWSGEKAFALWRAAVSDRGAVAGYAYADERPSDVERLRLFVLSPQGEILNEDVHVPAPPTGCTCPGPDAPSTPTARGLATPFFVHDELGRVVFRIRDRDRSHGLHVWWVYELERGYPIAKLDPLEMLPDSEHVRFDVQALPVPGTPLVLVHWYRFEQGIGTRTDRIGARFTLHDAEWKVVWQHDLPADYVASHEENAQRRLIHEMQIQGAILGVGPGGRFELHVCSTNERVGFEVERVPESKGEWDVRVVSREPYVPPIVERPSASPIELEPLESVPLGTLGDVAPGPIRDIEEYALLPGGEIEFVRREASRDEFSIVRVDRSGRVLSELTIPRFELGQRSTSWVHLANGDWLLVASRYGRKDGASAWTTDGTELVPLEGFECASVESIAAAPDGGFVVLGYAYVFGLLRFDGQGHLLWSVEEESDDPSKLFSPEDVAVTSDGRILVLDNIRNSLQAYDLAGNFLESRDLVEAFGAEPRYVSDVEPDPEGGVLILDFAGSPPIWRLDASGRVRSCLELSDPEGATGGDLEYRTKIAPDGRLWSTDGRVFVELDARGAVRRCVGDPPRSQQMYEPGAACLDATGRIVVQDERTANVYVYDAQGRRLVVGAAKPGDVETVTSNGRLAISGLGCLYAERLRQGNEYLAFGPEGTHGGLREFGAELVTFGPGSEQYWCAKDGVILRRDPDDTEIQRIERRPDRKFFADIEDLSIAPDGRLAVLDGSDLVLFDASGTAGEILALPPDTKGSHLSFSGRWAAIGDRDPDLLLVDTRDGSLHRFTPAPAPPTQTTWHFGFSPDGKELWMLETDAMVLHRFALP